MSKSPRPQTITFIFMTVVLDMLGIGIIIPVLPDVIRRFVTDPDQITQLFGYFVATYSVMQFVASPILGIVSDRYGRRPILLSSLLGAAIDYVVMAMAPTLGILFIGRLISGLTGASMTVANSYMADVSNDENRAANFGMIGAAFGIGFIAGPLVGGAMGQLGSAAPFWAAAVLNFVNFIFCFYFLPESLSLENRRKIDWKKMNPFSTLRNLFRNRAILIFALGYALLFLAGNVHPSIWTLYTEHRYGWTSFQVGLSLSFVGLVYGFSQAVLTKKLTPIWGEEKSLIVGIVFNIIGFFLYAIVEQGWMMYGVMLVSCLSALSMPNLQAIMTKRCPPDQQGELQGSLVSIVSLSSIAAPLVYTSAFRMSLAENSSLPVGIPYFLASAISALCLGLIYSKLKKA